jgi:hypothetical protein
VGLELLLFDGMGIAMVLNKHSDTVDVGHYSSSPDSVPVMTMTFSPSYFL